MAEIPKSSFDGPLAPKFGLTDNARGSFPIKEDPKPRRKYSSLIPVAGIAIAILVIPLTIQQLNQQQDVRQQASEPTPTLPIISPTTTPVISESPTSTASPSLSPSAPQDERNRSFGL